MMISIRSTIAGSLAAAVFAVAVSGCATFASTPEKIVEERATQQWSAKIARDWTKSYEFLPPSSRSVTSLDSYQRGFGAAVQWKSAEVVSVTCETPEKCVANMKIVALPSAVLARRTVPPITAYLDEVWVLEGGKWWLFPTP